MATTSTRQGQGLGWREPSLDMVVLRACPGCSGPHPQALGLDSSSCPQCGTICPIPTETRHVAAALTGLAPWTLAARLLLWLGRCLAQLAGSL